MLPKNGSNPISDLCFTNTRFPLLIYTHHQNRNKNFKFLSSSSSSFHPFFLPDLKVMGEGKNQRFKHHHHHQTWDVKKESYEQDPCSSIEETSTISNGSSLTCSSSSSFDTTDDASSSSANSSRSSLYDLSDLMSQLPIKRGLSKFYHGKSDSFTSLARVTSIEDLPKKEKKKMKKSYRSHTLPKPAISKKNSRKKKFGATMKKKKAGTP